MGLMKKSTSLVSCIIPTKNRPELVRRAIDSVLTQGHENIEIIVIDDSTNDETKAILLSYGSKIRYIKNEKSRGAPFSRNVGLDEAKGDAIAFLDDDDIWLPEKTERQLEFLERYPLVTCNYITEVKGRKQFVHHPDIINYDDLLFFNFLGSCSCVMLRGDAAKDCYFDESVRVGQDWDYWLTIMKRNGAGEAGNVGKYLVNYNNGDFARISTTNDALSSVLQLYSKREKEYTRETAKMLLLYNVFDAGSSSSSWVFREWMKAKSKRKGGILFIIRLIIKRIFGRVEYF